MKKYKYNIIVFGILILLIHCTNPVSDPVEEDYIDSISINYNQGNYTLFVEVKLFDGDDISVEGVLNMNNGDDISFDLNDQGLEGDIIPNNNTFSKLISFEEEPLDYGTYSVDIYVMELDNIVEQNSKEFSNEMQYVPEIINYNFYKILEDKTTQYMISQNDEGEYIYPVNDQDSSFIFFDINIRDQNGSEDLFIKYELDRDDLDREDCEYIQSNVGYMSLDEWFFVLNESNENEFNYNIVNEFLDEDNIPGVTKYSVDDCTGLGDVKIRFLVTDDGLNQEIIFPEEDSIILKFIRCGDGEWNCEEECSECIEECGLCND